jgi:alkylhydroperoxidase family enzyme
MAHLPALPPEAIADPALAEMSRATGDEMFGVYGHAPEAFSAFLAFYRPLKYDGRLPFPLKELVRLRIAALNGCHR